MKNPQNTTIVCTVFEGHYHKGVAALVNSLSVNGFEGTIYAGYKGALPPWAVIEAKEKNYEVMRVKDNLKLHFLKFPDTAFLPYCKPNFMLDLFDTLEPQAERVIYFDCDIVVKCTFSYFEQWSDFGIMLVEDINSPISTTDPLRYQWVDYFKKHDISVRRDSNQYVNGGFIGMNRRAKGFLNTWNHIQNLVLEDMNAMKVDVHKSHLPEKISGLKDRTYMFNRTDQDALNVAKDTTEEVLAIADSSAMDFKSVGFVMSHAAAKEKPWEKNWLKFVLKNGQRPSPTDRIFLNYTVSPISIYNNRERKIKQIHLKLASILGRVLA
jgi:hypothetical protein